MSCDPDLQYKIVLILQSDWTCDYGGGLHKLIYVTFPGSVACEKSGNETSRTAQRLFKLTTFTKKLCPCWLTGHYL